MNVLTDPFTPANYPDLFTLMWVAGILISLGSIVVYNIAQRRYRRYPELLALHEWIFWPIIVTWGVVPLLVVIGVPLIIQLLIVLTGMGLAAYATFVRFPPRIAAATMRSGAAATCLHRSATSASARSRRPPDAAAGIGSRRPRPRRRGRRATVQNRREAGAAVGLRDPFSRCVHEAHVV